MADLQPQVAFAAGPVAASGETAGFALNGPGAFVASVVTAVAGSSPSLQCFLDCQQDGQWLQVAALTAQSAAGVQSASVTLPPDTQPAYRLRWTVSGAGAEFFGRMFAAGVF